LNGIWAAFVVAAALESIKVAASEYQAAIVKGRIAKPVAVKVLATYERTFVSPPTRFDRWVAGEAQALAGNEVAGLRLFAGKAGCVKCHSGFAFTDYAFHDIGLPGEDRGRGAVLRLTVAEHAFKTPGCASSAAPLRTCTTACSRRSRTWCGITRAGSSSARRSRRTSRANSR
jgi:cytochrome c peroxidase